LSQVGASLFAPLEQHAAQRRPRTCHQALILAGPASPDPGSSG
jgi:hypothetical protein